MNKATDEIENVEDIDLKDHYDFDYSKAKPNRFATRLTQDCLMVVIDPDVGAIFPTSEAVNEALRVLAAAARTLPTDKPLRQHKARTRAAQVAQP